MMEENEDEMYEAVYKDLRKCRTEANLVELLQVRLQVVLGSQDLGSGGSHDFFRGNYRRGHNLSYGVITFLIQILKGS